MLSLYLKGSSHEKIRSRNKAVTLYYCRRIGVAIRLNCHAHEVFEDNDSKVKPTCGSVRSKLYSTPTELL